MFWLLLRVIKSSDKCMKELIKKYMLYEKFIEISKYCI